MGGLVGLFLAPGERELPEGDVSDILEPEAVRFGPVLNAYEVVPALPAYATAGDFLDYDMMVEDIHFHFFSPVLSTGPC